MRTILSKWTAPTLVHIDRFRCYQITETGWCQQFQWLYKQHWLRLYHSGEPYPSAFYLLAHQYGQSRLRTSGTFKKAESDRIPTNSEWHLDSIACTELSNRPMIALWHPIN